MQATLLIIGAGLIFVWGIGRLIPTRNVVAGFGPLSADNERIITMEWIAVGLTLCFVGAVVALFVLVLGGESAPTSSSSSCTRRIGRSPGSGSSSGPRCDGCSRATRPGNESHSLHHHGLGIA